MTQQPNQNYPQQPGQGWGQQQPQDQWGQPQQPAAPQWGQQQQAYGQPVQPWGAPVVGNAGGGAGAALGKPWALFVGLGAAVIAGIMAFFPWASTKVTSGLGTLNLTVTALGHEADSIAGKSQGGSAEGFNKTWGILLLVSAVVVLAGAVLTIVTKQKPALFAALGGAGLVLVFAVVEALYVNSKFSDEKKAIALEFGQDPTAKYTIGLGWAAYAGLALGAVAVVFMVLALLSFGNGVPSAAPVATGYAADYGQQSGYGQQVGYQQPQAQQQWGQPQGQPQQQWDQTQVQPQSQWDQTQVQPQPQQQWGQPAAPAPQQQGWGQQPGDPANQPTQAVQQYPPQQQ